MIEASDNAMTNPVPEASNADHAVDPAARLLRQMLGTLMQHRQAQADSESEDNLKSLDEILAIMPPPPRWIRHMEAAAKDGVDKSLVASIREEGWRAFAEGGLDAMRQLANQACGDDGRLLTLLDHRWDGIGTRRHGHWVC